VRTIGIVLASAVFCFGVGRPALAQTVSPVPAPPSTNASAPPAVLQRPDLSALWQPGVTLRYHRTTPGPGKGDFSRYVLDEVVKSDCPTPPCSKWHGYLPDPHGGPDVEDYEYYDGDGNLYKLTTKKGRSVFSCYPRYLQFPLKVPSDVQLGCSAVGFNGNGADHSNLDLHYEWERVKSTYTGTDPVWAVHVTIKVTCSRCSAADISHRYYYPQKAVWILRIDGGSLYDLTSIAPASG
jgi:hypothetical protein